jgi:hypothetical protein
MIISACLNAMSEHDVADMSRINGLFDFEEEVEED